MKVRVYYEDTDAAGVVYHSNYLNFCERARTEFFRDRGFPVGKLAGDGYVFPVVRMEIDFKSGARHDELLQINTDVMEVGGSSFTLKQQIVREDDAKLLVEMTVKLACVSSSMKAKRVPEDLRNMLLAEKMK